MEEQIEMQNEVRLNLYQKLAKIRTISDAAKKNKKGYGYTYTDITEILAKVTAGMNKYGVSLIPGIVPGTGEVVQNVTRNTKVDKTGTLNEVVSTEMLFKADMIWKWVNDEDPAQVIEVPWVVVGAQSDPSQAMGSGLTYTTRQFLTAYFQIAQTDQDVDAYRSRQKEAEGSEDRAVAEALIENFDTMVKSYMSDHPEKRDEIVKFIKRYDKNSNYFAIKEPKLAAKLVEDFKNKFMGE